MTTPDQPTEAKTYPDFLDDMGKLLLAGMPRTDRERDELFAAEAEVRRLRSQLAVAEEREQLSRQRYDRERAVLMEMFGAWKGEVMSLRDDGETPVRMVPDTDLAPCDYCLEGLPLDATGWHIREPGTDDLEGIQRIPCALNGGRP